MSNKNCPFCNSSQLSTREYVDCNPEVVYIYCDSCHAQAKFHMWNCRPHTKILKNAIDELIKGINFILNNQFTHRMNERKLIQVRDYAVKIIKQGSK